MGDLSTCVDGCKIFSKLDLQKGYYQVLMAAAYIHKITLFGLFDFVCMSFGLENAGMIFQHLIDCIFIDLPFCFVYMDNLLVTSHSIEEMKIRQGALLAHFPRSWGENRFWLSRGFSSKI
jgi:hypothetical protein